MLSHKRRANAEEGEAQKNGNGLPSPRNEEFEGDDLSLFSRTNIMSTSIAMDDDGLLLRKIQSSLGDSQFNTHVSNADFDLFPSQEIGKKETVSIERDLNLDTVRLREQRAYWEAEMANFNSVNDEADEEVNDIVLDKSNGNDLKEEDSSLKLLDFSSEIMLLTNEASKPSFEVMHPASANNALESIEVYSKKDEDSNSLEEFEKLAAAGDPTFMTGLSISPISFGDGENDGPSAFREIYFDEVAKGGEVAEYLLADSFTEEAEKISESSFKNEADSVDLLNEKTPVLEASKLEDPPLTAIKLTKTKGISPESLPEETKNFVLPDPSEIEKETPQSVILDENEEEGDFGPPIFEEIELPPAASKISSSHGSISSSPFKFYMPSLKDRNTSTLDPDFFEDHENSLGSLGQGHHRSGSVYSSGDDSIIQHINKNPANITLPKILPDPGGFLSDLEEEEKVMTVKNRGIQFSDSTLKMNTWQKQRREEEMMFSPGEFFSTRSGQLGDLEGSRPEEERPLFFTPQKPEDGNHEKTSFEKRLENDNARSVESSPLTKRSTLQMASDDLLLFNDDASSLVAKTTPMSFSISDDVIDFEEPGMKSLLITRTSADEEAILYIAFHSLEASELEAFSLSVSAAFRIDEVSAKNRMEENNRVYYASIYSLLMPVGCFEQKLNVSFSPSKSSNRLESVLGLMINGYSLGESVWAKMIQISYKISQPETIYCSLSENILNIDDSPRELFLFNDDEQNVIFEMMIEPRNLFTYFVDDAIGNTKHTIKAKSFVKIKILVPERESQAMLRLKFLNVKKTEKTIHLTSKGKCYKAIQVNNEITTATTSVKYKEFPNVFLEANEENCFFAQESISFTGSDFPLNSKINVYWPDCMFKIQEKSLSFESLEDEKNLTLSIRPRHFPGNHKVPERRSDVLLYDETHGILVGKFVVHVKFCISSKNVVFIDGSETDPISIGFNAMPIGGVSYQIIHIVNALSSQEISYKIHNDNDNSDSSFTCKSSLNGCISVDCVTQIAFSFKSQRSGFVSSEFSIDFSEVKKTLGVKVSGSGYEIYNTHKKPISGLEEKHETVSTEIKKQIEKKPPVLQSNNVTNTNDTSNNSKPFENKNDKRQTKPSNANNVEKRQSDLQEIIKNHRRSQSTATKNSLANRATRQTLLFPKGHLNVKQRQILKLDNPHSRATRLSLYFYAVTKNGDSPFQVSFLNEKFETRSVKPLLTSDTNINPLELNQSIIAAGVTLEIPPLASKSLSLEFLPRRRERQEAILLIKSRKESNEEKIVIVTLKGICLE